MPSDLNVKYGTILIYIDIIRFSGKIFSYIYQYANGLMDQSTGRLPTQYIVTSRYPSI